MEYFSIGSDVKSPAVRERASYCDNTVRLGNGFSRVAEDHVARTRLVAHATTLVANAVIERKGVTNDQRLVEVAAELSGRIITNDFNLNKVASLQGVTAINHNDVANALKPRFVPGDLLRTKIAKEGESAGQGVGFLDDGTMVVCEQASSLLDTEISVVVTSVLQSSAGRMIFGRKADDNTS